MTPRQVLARAQPHPGAPNACDFQRPAHSYGVPSASISRGGLAVWDVSGPEPLSRRPDAYGNQFVGDMLTFTFDEPFVLSR
jgi:hypothetical protein